VLARSWRGASQRWRIDGDDDEDEDLGVSAARFVARYESGSAVLISMVWENSLLKTKEAVVEVGV
jgi:hypothetical protein